MLKSVNYLLVLLLVVLLIFLAFNKHSKSGYNNYHSEIWADKAGYYVYLPATFKYQLDAKSFPDSIDLKTGNGFFLDRVNGGILTKYTYGVAFMQLPFYLLADVCAAPLGYLRDGFSPVYHWAINLAAVFYLVCGLLFLNAFLRHRFPKWVRILTLTVFVLGTNLYYYAIDDTGMSHVYSFFLFSLALYLFHRKCYLQKPNFGSAFYVGLVFTLIVVVRPINALFLLTFLFLDNAGSVWDRIRFLFRKQTYIAWLLAVFLVLLPQIIFWKITRGQYVIDTYENEKFEWFEPKLLQIWFAPNNGLILYSPLYIIILGSFIYAVRHRFKNGMVAMAIFLLLSYITSCWWARAFGCSFGNRNFVEYLSIFIIPFCYFVNALNQKSSGVKMVFYLALLVAVGYNLKLVYSFDKCYYGIGTWDWQFFAELLMAPTK